MSLTVTFYKYSGNPKVIHKSLGSATATITINPTEFYDDQEPKLILNYNSTIYANANYCSIGGDYYFIEDRGLDTAERMILILQKDLLKTNAAEIDATDIITQRDYMGDSWIVDPLQVRTVQKVTQNYEMGDIGRGFTRGGRVILAAIGSKDVV